MRFHSPPTKHPSLLDDSLAQHPDVAELTVVSAVRTWLRPQCESVRTRDSWRDVLSDAGMTADGLTYFDMLMRSLMRTACRPLDMRCRCATELANDEASLLQTIALLQKTHSQAAMQLLNDWLPQPAVSGLLKIVRWFAISLLDAGLVIRVRARHVTYLH